MESTETAKARAEGRVKLAAVVLGMLILAGAVREYREAFAPVDEATVVYVSAREENAAEAVAEKGVVGMDVTATEAQEDGAAAFLSYMNQLNGDLEEMTKPESALDKIVIPVQPEPEEIREELFEDGKIEIFDSEEGVIRTEEATEAAAGNETGRVAEAADDAENTVGESETEQIAEAAETVQPEESVEVEPVKEVVEAVKTEETAPKPEAAAQEGGDVFEAAEDDGEAIDLMKGIAERAATEDNGQ